MSEGQPPVWGGFWQRILAFLLDGLIMGAAGFGIAAAFSEELSSAPWPTRLVGLAVATLYFGFLTSNIGGSATLGMRMLGLRVRRLDGRSAGLHRTIWRALVLQAPIMLNGIFIASLEPWVYAFGVVAITCVFGVSLAQIILLLFNGPTRRLVHDLVSDTAVVRAAATPAEVAAAPRGGKIAPFIAFSVIALVFAVSVLMAVFGAQIMKGVFPQFDQSRFKAMAEAQRAVNAAPAVVEAGVQEGTSSFTQMGGETTTTRFLTIRARLSRWPDDETAKIDEIARAALTEYDLEPGQQVHVTLTRGFDIGIASAWRSYSAPWPAPGAAPAAPSAPTPGAVAPAAPEPASPPQPEG